MSDLIQRIEDIGKETKASITRSVEAIIAEIDRHVAAVASSVSAAEASGESTRALLTGLQQQMSSINESANAALVARAEELNKAISGGQSPTPAG